MGTQNIVYKGKSLHVHRNKKNHILENQNDKYTHCFLIHLNIKIKNEYKKCTNPWPNSQRLKAFFSKNTSNLPFLALESQTKNNKKNCNFNHKILP
jgi:hypothetical protein